MKILIDQNGFLCIEHPEIPQTKQYTNQVSGFQFSDWDKWMIVLHKKDFKILNLKHFGEKMSLVYIKEKWIWELSLNQKFVKQGYGLFWGFDEVSGESKFFWPGVRRNLDLFVPASCDWKFGGLEDILSFFYGLLLLYGKLESKKWDLMSIKIQIPLFGQFLKHQENFDDLLLNLQKEGLFVKRDILESGNGVVYQISSTDWELLSVFSNWHQAIEKFEKINKKVFVDDMKAWLLAFLLSESQIPEKWKQDVLEQIQSGIIKFVTK